MSASQSNRKQQRLAAFESLAHQLGVGTFEVDDVGVISSADRMAASMLGYESRAELIGRQISELFRDTDLEFGATADAQESFPGTIVTQDGNTVPVLMDRFPLLTSAGKDGYIALIRDISASEEIAEILRDDWLLPDIIDQLPIRVVHKDREGKFTFANELFCRELGVNRNEVVGKTDYDLYSSSRASGYVADDQSVLEDNRSFQTIEWHEPRIKSTAPSSDLTSSFPVQVVKTALRSTDGCVTGIRIFFWQLTDRERILVELIRAKESYLESLLAHLPLWIFRKDADLRFTYVSDRWCELIGKKREEVLRRTDFDIFPEHLAKKYAEDDQYVLDTGMDFEDDEPNTAGGKNLMVHVLKTPIRNAGNSVVGLQGVFWDVTEIHDAMEQKTILLQELHHRVKNNLANIVALISMQKSAIGDSEAVNALQDCQNRVTAMELIHAQLLNSDDFARIEFGSYVDQLVASVLETSSYSSGQLTYTTSVEETQVTIDFAVPCGLVLNELVTNAVQHAGVSKSTSNLSVAVKSAKDGSVLLSVCDDGQGMPDGVCLETGNGLGTGLQLVRHIVTKQLKGKIKHSRPLAHFQLEFPSFITRGIDQNRS